MERLLDKRILKGHINVMGVQILIQPVKRESWTWK